MLPAGFLLFYVKKRIKRIVDMQQCYQDSPDIEGILDGTTILRFTHATSSFAGTESHIGHLNRILLLRNRMNIVYFYLPEENSATKTEILIGKGRVIKIPLHQEKSISKNDNKDGIKSVMKRIANSNFYYIARENIFPYLNCIPVLASLIKWKNHNLESRLASDITSIAGEVFSSYNINLLVNHYAGGSDSLEMMRMASFRNIPILILNHFSNKWYYRSGFREQVGYAQAVAGLSNVDIPGYLRHRYVNLSNGIDTDFFNPDALPDSNKDAQSKPVILLPSRVVRQKGHIELIKTALELKRENIECILVFAGKTGSDDYKRELDQIIEKNNFKDNVIFTGMIDQTVLREWYKKSKLVVLPTYHQEGLPRVLLEAQAMEVPPISYDRGGVSEAIIQNQTGFFFKCGDRSAIRKKMVELLKNEQLRIQIGKNGRTFMLNNFSLPLLARRHEKLYAQLIRNNK